MILRFLKLEINFSDRFVVEIFNFFEVDLIKKRYQL